MTCLFIVCFCLPIAFKFLYTIHLPSELRMASRELNGSVRLLIWLYQCVDNLNSCFLQTYVKSQDKQFAAATIQAIGRCATNISEVTDTCLNGLVCLLSNRDGKLIVLFWRVTDGLYCLAISLNRFKSSILNYLSSV